MLIHICCSVDSHYFLQRLKDELPKSENIVGYFYNPNIHPESEYLLRLEDVKRSSKKLGIEIIDDGYDDLFWIKSTEGFECEPEGGERCEVCFELRLEKSAKKAIEIGERRFSTTLLTSPKKSIEKLSKTGKAIAEEHDLEFVVFDFRKSGGTQKQFELAKKELLYKQNYCGCYFALKNQRTSQQKVAIELFLPIDRSILPGSIEERDKIYKEVDFLRKDRDIKIFKERFQNYRLTFGKISSQHKTIPSYILSYSTISRRKIKTDITTKGDMAYLNKDSGVLITLRLYNELMSSCFDTIEELIFAKKDIAKELSLREKIYKNPLNRSFIAVVENIDRQKYEIEIGYEIFEDSRDIIV